MLNEVEILSWMVSMVSRQDLKKVVTANPVIHMQKVTKIMKILSQDNW